MLSSHPLQSLGVQAVIVNGASVLLLQRSNTGYCDGLYGLPSGCIEAGETPLDALCREVFEETGLLPLVPQLLSTLETVNDDGTPWFHYIFCVRAWLGDIMNCEPHKCSDLRFYPVQQLPPNIIPYVRTICVNLFLPDPKNVG